MRWLGPSGRNRRAPPSGPSLVNKAVRGAAWTIGSGIGSRLLGVAGTLLLTYYLSPEVIGEVAGASLLVMTATQLSTLGVGQYVISKKADSAVTWHATVIHLAIGVVALSAIWAFGHLFSGFLNSPSIGVYLPGFVVAAALDRFAFMPERVLARDMRFRSIGVARTVGEVTYTLVSVVLAMRGLGGDAIVWANVARSLIRTIVFIGASGWSSWFSPRPLSRAVVRDMMRFSLPLSMGHVAEFAARRWDNLAFAALFGPGVMGAYNQAYNLAEIPGNQIGEQIGDVLLPTFASVDLETKKRALLRSIGLISLVVFPLAIGLGAVAPTVVGTLLRREWHEVAPMLAILSVMSVVRPVGWTISAYLQARDQTRPLLWLEFGKAAMLLGFIVALSAFGPLWSCAGVGLAFGGHALASMWVVDRSDRVGVRAILLQCARPLVACVPMVGGVLAVRWGLARAGVDIRGMNLALEILAGTSAYVAGVFLIAPAMAADMLQLVRNAIRRRAAPSTAEPASA